MSPDNNPSKPGSTPQQQGPRGSSNPGNSSQAPRSGSSGASYGAGSGSSSTQVKEQVTQKASQAAEDTKGRVAEQVKALAMALRRATDELRQGNQSSLAGRVDQVGDKLQSASQFLRDKSPTEIKDELEDFARRQPSMFLGGAFVLGLLSARFLKSSERSRRTARRGSSREWMPSARGREDWPLEVGYGTP